LRQPVRGQLRQQLDEKQAGFGQTRPDTSGRPYVIATRDG